MSRGDKNIPASKAKRGNTLKPNKLKLDEEALANIYKQGIVQEEPAMALIRQFSMDAMSGGFQNINGTLMDKVKSEHIDKIIDIENKRIDCESSNKYRELIFYVAVFICVLLFAFACIWLSKDNAELLRMITPLLTALAGGGIGAFGGYGFGYKKGSKQD